MRKYRKSHYAVPGQRVLHYGLADDFKDKDPNVQFGSAVIKSDHVEDVWGTPGIGSEYAESKYTQKEAVYHSAKREPLGKSFSRGQVMPSKFSEPEFRFGKPSERGASAKPLLYPKVQEDPAAHKAQYVKSHNAYDPGEQKRRDYKWQIDPLEYRFGQGMGSQTAMNGASAGVAMALTTLDHPHVASKQVESFKALGDKLGRGRNLGHGDLSHHPERYGKASSMVSGLDVTDARACLEGDYAWEDQQPDLDLGVSLTPGFRNVTSEARAFGTPSVRSDIPKPSVLSVADNQNYGDDVSAQFLLYPQQFSAMGVDDFEFLKPRGKTELVEIFKVCSKDPSEAALDKAWDQTPKNQLGEACLRDFQLAYNRVLESP